MKLFHKIKGHSSISVISIFFFYACFFSRPLSAQIEVAWMELRNYHGEVIQLEPNFYFAHIAIKWKGQWLHAHPSRGVEWVSLQQLEGFGKIKEILVSDKDSEFLSKEVPRFLGRPFDSEFSWSDEKIYCAELIAKLLNIKPTPMHFDLKYWNPWYQKYEGYPGSSPAKLYHELQQQGYRRFVQRD